MRKLLLQLAMLCALQRGFGQEQNSSDALASAPATSLQSSVSHFTESLLSAANSTFTLPQLPLLPNRSSLLPPLPWAQPEETSAVSTSQGLAAASGPEASASGWTVAPDLAPSGADAPALAPSGPGAPAQAPSPAAGSALFPELANPPSASGSDVRSFQAAAAASNATAVAAARQQQQQSQAEGPPAAAAQSGNSSMSESKAIGALVASSVQLGADLAASGHAVSLATDDRAAFVAKLKGDFEALSLAIANLPVGLIPFPDVAKAALQRLNADVVHGVTSGTLDIGAIAADREAVASALGGLGPDGATDNKLV